MKTLLAIITAIFATNFAIASGNLNVNFATKNADLTLVEISNTKMSNYEIDVKDEYGVVLYSMKTETPISEFKKRYDFSGLDNGIYWYSVKIDKEKVTKRLQVNNGNVEVLNVRKDVEPVFTRNGNMLKLTFLNVQQEDIKLFVYDEKNNDLLAEANLGNNTAIHKALNLSDLRYGNYNVVVANDDEIYEYRLSIE